MVGTLSETHDDKFRRSEDGYVYGMVPGSYRTVSEMIMAQSPAYPSVPFSSWFHYIPTRLDYSDLPTILGL